MFAHFPFFLASLVGFVIFSCTVLFGDCNCVFIDSEIEFGGVL